MQERIKMENAEINNEKMRSCVERFIDMVVEHKLTVIETAALLQVLVISHRDRFKYEVIAKEVQADENEQPMADTVWN